ncbi:MAG: hypothetical protein A7316_02240 [Candidatus Altiarchaeales archaeon WOR_SM1_86-2]|nr:MAG: hypothetical protein A7316_02240 [Candidatus Altiarchaeales archaeon WOR_SM1_86-2]
MERARIIVKGEVQKVGFRSSIVEQMKSVKLKGYAENLPDGMVEVVCEGEKEKIEELINRIKETPPHFARVDSAEPEWQEYVGDLKEPDRREEDVPVEGTQEKMLKVMQSFDQKAEIVVVTLGNMDKRLESIDGKQDQMLDKQDQMLDKQDSTIDKIDDMHHDLAGRFDNLRGDYGVIHKTILEMLDEMRKERKESNERTEKLVKAILQSKKG